MKKQKYVSIGKPLIFKKFKIENKPFGWFNLKNLLKNKEKLKEFSKNEIKELKNHAQK